MRSPRSAADAIAVPDHHVSTHGRSFRWRGTGAGADFIAVGIHLRESAGSMTPRSRKSHCLIQLVTRMGLLPHIRCYPTNGPTGTAYGEGTQHGDAQGTDRGGGWALP